MGLKKIIKTIAYSMKRLNLGEQAAQLTFYLLLSLVPIILIIGNIIPLFPISIDRLLQFLHAMLPKEVFELVSDMLTRYLNSYNGGSLSFGIIIALWSSSQAFNVMQRVFNKIYHTPMRSNFFISRLFSFLLSFIFVMVIIATGLVLSYGSTVLRVLQDFTIIRPGIDVIFDNMKWVVAFGLLCSLFSVMYYTIPNVNRRFRDALPGGLFATVGVLVASQGYAIYVNNAVSSALTDGTIGVFIVLMLWLHVMSMVIIIGAWINVLYYDYKHEPFMKKELYEEIVTTQIYYSKGFIQENKKDDEKQNRMRE